MKYIIKIHLTTKLKYYNIFIPTNILLHIKNIIYVPL